MAFQFPDPNTTAEFVGDNGITYAWDATDEKWVIKSFSTRAEFDGDLPMQLRGYFEMDATGTYAILPNEFIEEYYDSQTGQDFAYQRAGVWWIDPSFNTSNSPRYRPLTLTHLLIHGGRYVDSWDEETQEYVYDDAELAPEFWPGDYINISARGIDIYQPEDDPGERKAWGQRFDDVWRVLERYEVKDDNNVAPGWRFGNSLWAYKVEKAVRDHAYTQREWTIYEIEDNEISRIFCTVQNWHDINDIQRHVYGGEERHEPVVKGRSEAEVANWDGDNGELADAGVRKTFFNPTQNYVAFNKDIIPSGQVSWSVKLEPYPQHVFLKFDNGEKINFVVEFIARAGLNNRSYNFRILDRGNLPLGDLSSIDGVEFEVYRFYEAPRTGLQTQIDNLLDFSQYEELP